MPVFENWLKNPTQIIDNIFESNPLKFETKVNEYFEEKLKSEKNYNSIPCLNDVQLHELTPNCLVRYRCMIQDSFDPVYYTYVQEFRNKTNPEDKIYMTLKYKETMECPEGYEPTGNSLKDNLMDVLSANMNTADCPNKEEILKEKVNNLHQRLTYYCVPIPGETQWVKSAYKSADISIENFTSNTNFESNKTAFKRGIDATEQHDNMIVREEITDETVCKMCMKIKTVKVENSRPMVEGGETPVQTIAAAATSSMEISENQEVNTTETQTININKKTKVEEVKETKIVDNEHGFNLNFPLGSSETGTPALVKVYDDLESLKINDMVEFIGILSHDPSLAYMHDEHRDHALEMAGYELIGEQDENIAESFNLNINEKDEKQVTLLDKEQQEALRKAVSEHSGEICSCKEELKISLTKTHTKHKHKQILSAFPPSLVPRLHCIRAVPLIHNNPLLEQQKEMASLERGQTSEEDYLKKVQEEQFKLNGVYWEKELEKFLKQIVDDSTHSKWSTTDPSFQSTAQMHLFKLRKEIIGIFQELLLGDSLAAEYLLMHLLSSVFLRRDVTILGKFCLNLTNIPKPFAVPQSQDTANSKPVKTFAQCLYNALSQIFSMGHLFELTVNTLNKSNMIPCKDYNKNKLNAGMLQLPVDFNLIIDETQLDTGKLDQKGLMNFNSLRDIITWQKLSYDFSYHQQEFSTNMKVLTLSETKSILPCDFQVKLQPNVDRFDADSYESFAKHIFESSSSSNNLLNNIRSYFTILSKMTYKLSEPMQNLVEEDIVHIRTNSNDKTNTNTLNKKEKLGIDDFHLLLVVARLQTFSYGKGELSLHEWNRAKSLEFERLNNRVLNKESK